MFSFSLCNAEFSPCWALTEYVRALIHLACLRVFSVSHGLLFTSCIVWNDKDKVIGFKRSHWVHLGCWSNWSQKFQLFQLSQHSHVTNCRLISSSAHFPWIKIQKCSNLKVPDIKAYILCREHSVFRREKYFFPAVCLSKRYTKVSEVVFATSL